MMILEFIRLVKMLLSDRKQKIWCWKKKTWKNGVGQKQLWFWKNKTCNGTAQHIIDRWDTLLRHKMTKSHNLIITTHILIFSHRQTRIYK